MNAGGAESVLLMSAGTGKPALDAAEFEALYLRLRQVPAWDPADRRGASTRRLIEQSVERSIDEVASDLRLSVDYRIPLPSEAQRSAYEADRGLDYLVESRGRQAHRYWEIDLPARRGDREGKDGR